MFFNSLLFLKSFIILLLCLYLVQILFDNHKKKHIQLMVIFIFSCIFMCKFDWRFCLSIVAVSLFSYICGLKIYKCKKRETKKTICTVSIIILTLYLGFFKYFNFFIDGIGVVPGNDIVVARIILPVGISFYVFSAMSYLFDVYREKVIAERNIFNFLFYMLYFPKIIAGPIVRVNNFIPQVENYLGVNIKYFCVGVQLYAFGLFKKIVLADRLKVFVDDVFYAPSAYNTATVLLCVFSYSLQIYFDFSGYSDMAMGLSKILGFDITENFNLPYIAKNMSDFWKRWHISLSSWLKDYIYIPLGGSKNGECQTYRNIMTVMLISGLWHGTGWTFILWGALHGVCSCISYYWNRHCVTGKMKSSALYTHFMQLLTFITVSYLWILFRAENLSNARDVVLGTITLHTGLCQMYTWSFFAVFCLYLGTLFAYKHTVGMNEVAGYYPILDLSKFWNQVIFFTFVGITIILGYYGNNAFIYGRF